MAATLLTPATLTISRNRTMAIQAPEKRVAQASLTAWYGSRIVSKDELAGIETPAAVDRFKPIPHIELVEGLLYCLQGKGYRIIRDEYVLSTNDMKLFGLIVLENEFNGCQLAIGFRHSNDKSIALQIIAGYEVRICSNMSMYGKYIPILKKHTSGLVLSEAISTGVQKIEEKFWAPMQRQVTHWQQTKLSDGMAREIIYSSFIEKQFAPIRLIGDVHLNYFDNPVKEYREAFGERTLWSLSNAYTESFKKLSPLSKFKATQALSDFLEQFSVKPIDISAEATDSISSDLEASDSDVFETHGTFDE